MQFLVLCPSASKPSMNFHNSKPGNWPIPPKLQLYHISTSKGTSFFLLLSYIISVKCGVIQTFLYLLQAKLKSLILATASQFVERLYWVREQSLEYHKPGCMIYYYMTHHLSSSSCTGFHSRLDRICCTNHQHRSTDLLLLLRMFGSNDHRRKCILERKYQWYDSSQQRCWIPFLLAFL